jgi:predicted transcriptional regulator
MRYTITIPEQLEKRLSEFREEKPMPNSTIFQLALSQYLDTEQLLARLKEEPQLIKQLRTIVEKEVKVKVKVK